MRIWIGVFALVVAVAACFALLVRRYPFILYPSVVEKPIVRPSPLETSPAAPLVDSNPRIGDLYTTVVEKCGDPDDLARSIEQNRVTAVVEYRYSKERPWACRGFFYFDNYQLVRIVQ